MKHLFTLLSLFFYMGLYAQTPAIISQEAPTRAIEFPDVPGYQTLKCDFHIHTVFSDGNVWPTIRIQEALRDGLDAVAMTDHLEYQPHLEDIPHPDRNRSFDIAKSAAAGQDLIVVRGAEITRSMPPGHNNAIFIEDANRLLQDDALSVFREAKSQGAFTFWNHSNWTAQKPDGISELTDLHRQLITEGLLDGIEVVNEHTYSEEAFQIAVDQGITVIGTSDIHGLIDWDYFVAQGGHRPVTLVFAAEKTEEAIKEALFAGRTVAWHNNSLIGNSEVLEPLIKSSLSVKSAGYPEGNTVLSVQLENSSDAAFYLENVSDLTFHEDTDFVTVPPHSVVNLMVKTGEVFASLELAFRVLNAVSAPGEHPVLNLSVRPGRN